MKKIIKSLLSKFLYWLYSDHDGIIVPGIYWNKDKSQLLIDNKINIYAMDDIHLRSNQHFILSSGKQEETTDQDHRRGYHYGLWFNPDLVDTLPTRYVLDKIDGKVTLRPFDGRIDKWNQEPSVNTQECSI